MNATDRTLRYLATNLDDVQYLTLNDAYVLSIHAWTSPTATLPLFQRLFTRILADLPAEKIGQWQKETLQFLIAACDETGYADVPHTEAELSDAIAEASREACHIRLSRLGL